MQHIAAFSVHVASLSTSPPLPPALADEVPRTITLLNTPEHAAFTAMRARGAGVIDIPVLVVAADDGVLPQTREGIALSKKDSMNEDGYGIGMVVAINKTAVKHALLAERVHLEEFGDVPCVEVSGLTGLGLDKLLRARRTGRAEGRMLESRVDKGRGPITMVLLTQGFRSATPAFPPTISGWKEWAQAGDEVLEGSEDVVKNAIHNRNRNLAVHPLQEDVVLINEKLASNAADPSLPGPAEDHVKELHLIIEGDVSGNHIVKVRIIQAAAGELFMVTPPVIIEDHAPGEAVVQQISQVHGKHKVTTRVAGCRVMNSVIRRHKPVKAQRNDLEVYNGTLDPLKHAPKGSECVCLL
ncbi:hypothetical protein BS47DRAFT_1374145 [Hydnum rufescens UP504]|uniref:Tr-type G domain-containing protein n=1 Tax=Hydnum rufescens UP504 TaxID=1448309 RepID=A0A9P6AI58_9AGAM|nr:hypothetical protein BS47DRAFT_1374145 [Hydnum rufescens UP504]